MQSKETLKRLTNPPIKDGRKKPIDLGDMPEDMDLELTKVALYYIIEEILEKYKDGNLETKSLRHNIASEVFKKIVEEGWYLNLNNIKKDESKYTLPHIIEAVDIAIGDDGFRGKEVAEILINDTMQTAEDNLHYARKGEEVQNFISYRDTGDEHDGEPTTADEYNHEWLNEANRTGKESYLLINDRINELLERIQVLEKNKE